MGRAETIDGDYDYIIVGAGSAGCVLANRLSANPVRRVLLLEAGARDDWIWYHIPVGYLFAIGNPRSDWMFKTEPESGLNGRTLNYPRGKVIGGSSSINAMIYMRGQAADYDHWRQLGLTGWGWDDVLPYFKQHEDHFCCRISSSTRIISLQRALSTRSAVNCGSNGSACAGNCLKRFVTLQCKPASSRLRISTPATMKARVFSTSTRAAVGAGRRPAAFSSRR